MKAHTKRSEKAKRRRQQFLAERRGKNRWLRERQALIKSTAHALSAKPKVALDIETSGYRAFQKALAFGNTYGMRMHSGLSEQDAQTLKKTWNRLLFGDERGPKMTRDVFIAADYSDLELRVAALDHKTA